MIWQDLVIASGGFVLAAALLPSIRGRHKPAKWTCILTGGYLTVFSITFATLGLWVSAAGIGTNALMWWILLRQRISPSSTMAEDIAAEYAISMDDAIAKIRSTLGEEWMP